MQGIPDTVHVASDVSASAVSTFMREAQAHASKKVSSGLIASDPTIALSSLQRPFFGRVKALPSEVQAV